MTNFPGFYSQDIFNLLGGETISINEKVAYEMAFGASLAGVRTVVTFKSFGLNVAADPFLNSIVSGINAGLVLVLTEDVEVQGSQCRQDSRSYRDFFGGLWFEPSSLEDAYNIACNSFLFSEQLDIPIVIRLTNQFFELSGKYKRKNLIRKSFSLANSSKKYLIHPFYSREQRDHLEKKNKLIKIFVEKFYENEDLKASLMVDGCIVFGNCQRELLNYSNCEILRVKTYPAPINLINHFIKFKQKVAVLEQGNDYALRTIKSIIWSLDSIKVSSNTGLIPNHSRRYINWIHLENLFNGLKKINPSFVVGDLGQFTKENTDTIQACLCLGASIPIGIGLCEAGIVYPFCISGDASLMHAGAGIISELIFRKVNLGVIIIDNGGSQSTGGQMPLGGLDLLDNIKDIKINRVEYSKLTENDFSKLFHEAKLSGKTKIWRVITS